MILQAKKPYDDNDSRVTLTVHVGQSANYMEATATCQIKVVKKIRLYFDSMGGSAVESYLVNYPGTYGNLPEPTRPMYNFKGWYLNSSYTGSALTSSTVITTNDSHTLYAKWQLKAEVLMSSYKYNGTMSNPSISGDTTGYSYAFYYNTTGSNTEGTAWTNVTSSTYLNVRSYYMFAKLTPNGGGTAEYTQAVQFEVQQGDGWITLNPSSVNITRGTSSTSTTVTSHHGGTLSITSCNYGNASISGTTVNVTGLGSLSAGTTVRVVVRSGATTNYTMKEATFVINITEPPTNTPTPTPTTDPGGGGGDTPTPTPEPTRCPGNGGTTIEYTSSGPIGISTDMVHHVNLPGQFVIYDDVCSNYPDGGTYEWYYLENCNLCHWPKKAAMKCNACGKVKVIDAYNH